MPFAFVIVPLNRHWVGVKGERHIVEEGAAYEPRNRDAAIGAPGIFNSAIKHNRCRRQIFMVSAHTLNSLAKALALPCRQRQNGWLRLSFAGTFQAFRPHTWKILGK